MIRTFYTGKSGMYANQERLDAISNNIANSETMGYKRVDVGFKDLLTESLNRQGVPINNKSVMGTGVRTGEWIRDNSQGVLMETLRPTDIGLDGNGYMKVILPDGTEAYTRDGAFQIDSLGRLVDGRGNKVHLEYSNGYSEDNVKLTNSNFLIDEEGSLYIKQGGTFNKVAEIPAYTALGDDAFLSAGDNLFLPQQGANVQRTRNVGFYQGAIEGSNVDISQEFTDMIVTQRAFELSSRGVRTADEMWGMVNSLRGR